MTIVIGLPAPAAVLPEVPSDRVPCSECGTEVFISFRMRDAVPNLVPICPPCVIAQHPDARFGIHAETMAEARDALGARAPVVPPSHESIEQFLRDRYGK